jgi:tRNA (guanosine-2'-O-)-methyltransferase
VACAVSIYEAMRQKMNAGHYEKASLPQAQMESLLTQWGFEEETPEVYNNSKLKRS